MVKEFNYYINVPIISVLPIYPLGIRLRGYSPYFIICPIPVFKQLFILPKTVFLSMNRILTALLACWGVAILQAQPNLDYYWKGGSGDFNDPTMWWVNSFNSGQTALQAPISSNNVYFTNAAFPTTGATVSILGDANCKDMIWDNTITTTPTVTASTSIDLSIYGSLHLCTNMNWRMSGNLKFKAASGVCELLTNGNVLKMCNLGIELGATAELKLMDYLHIGNPIMTGYTPYQGWISLVSGHFNTNKQKITADFITSSSGISNRRLTMDSSDITVIGQNMSAWGIVFVAPNYAGFSANGSHLHIIRNGNVTSPQTAYGGVSTIQLDTVSVEQLYLRRVRIAQQTFRCKVLKLDSKLEALSLDDTNLYVDELHVSKNVTIVGTGQNLIEVDTIISPTGCEQATIMRVNGTTTIRKKTAGTLTFSNFGLSSITFSTTGGRAYIANNSIDLNANTGITINAPTSCPTDLWFRGGSTDWHTLSNWRDASGNIPTTLPTLLTNVYFDNQSFSTTVTAVQMLDVAYCRDMRWSGTRPAASLNMLAGFVMLNGTLEFASDMNAITKQNDMGSDLGRNFVAFGTNDSLITHGVLMQGYIYLARGADYTIVDTIAAAGIQQYAGSTLRAENVGAKITGEYIMAARYFTNTNFYFTGGSVSSVTDATVQYINSTFYFDTTGAQTAGGLVPNTVVRNRAFQISPRLNVQGNLTFCVSAQTSTQAGTGGQLTVSGDMNLARGIEIVLRDISINNTVTIGGNLNMMSTCDSIITLRTYSGNPIRFSVGGTANLDNTYLQGLNLVSPIVAINSVDGGNNTNISFPPRTNTTYFWRADKTAPTDFEGNWTDPNHWTTDSTKLVGDGLCLPTIYDDVVFDANSFSASSNGCFINASGWCRNFICRAGIAIKHTTLGVGNLFIKGSFLLHPTVSIPYAGMVHLIGSGDIYTAGVTLNLRELILNNPTGVWNLQSNFNFDGTIYGSENFGILRLLAGTLNTNNYAVTLDGRFESSNTNARSLILGSTVWTMTMRGVYRYLRSTPVYAWNTATSTNMTLTGGSFRFLNGVFRADGKALQMGSLTYPRVEIYDADETLHLAGNATYGYLHLEAEMNISGNNTFDSLYFAGGKTYKFWAGSIQTLTSPSGRIISGGSANSFVYLESHIPASQATFYKAYGDAFCADYLKIKDMHGTKLPLASVPAAYQSIHPFLLFQTGIYSDNINGTATGLWTFNLPVLVQPQAQVSNQITLCKVSPPMYVPLPLTGTSPYLIRYTWTDGTTTNTNTVTLLDDDSDPATVFTANLPVASLASTLTYTFDISTMRCAIPTASAVYTVRVSVPSPKVLVSMDRLATCEFTNDPTWYTMIDNIDEKPVVSLLDKVNASDNTALGIVNTNVYFDPTVQYYTYMGVSYPYLQRHWKIEPTNNSGARVRLYFTQAELNALIPFTYIGRQRGSLNIATDIQVFKFASGTIGVGGHTVVPHTVHTLLPANTTAFSSTTNVLAIEFEVSSFSHFIIVPKNEALLSLNIAKFDAQAEQNKQVRTIWEMQHDDDITHYIVEKTADGQHAEQAGEVVSRGMNTSVRYQYVDMMPYNGVSYYRVKAYKVSGEVEATDWKEVTITQANNVILYPNPADKTLQINMTTSSNWATIRLIDVLGHEVQTLHWDAAQSSILTLSTSHLENGVYTVQLEYEGGVIQQKRLLIQH